MITESELAALLRDSEVHRKIIALKKDLLRAEASFMDLSDDDFVSLVLMAPSVGITLANGTVSWFEEVSLNKKVRKLSRGSYFLKEDPIQVPFKYLLANFSEWENKFYELVQLIVFASLKKNKTVHDFIKNPANTTGNFHQDVLNAPFVIVRMIGFLFLEDNDDLFNTRFISEVELGKIKEIGIKIGLDELPLFRNFCESFILR